MGFKCCKTRISSCDVCKNGLQIFHRSCLAGMSLKKIKYYPDSIVICCAKDDKKSLLQGTILGLEEDINLTAQHLEKLKKNHSIMLKESTE